MANKHQATAQKKVTKAMTVFNQAITEVEKAQGILKKGIEKDTFKVVALEKQVSEIEAEIMAVKEDRRNKSEEIIKNNDLLKKLQEFSV